MTERSPLRRSQRDAEAFVAGMRRSTRSAASTSRSSMERSSRSSARAVPARRRCCSCWARSTVRRRADLLRGSRPEHPRRQRARRSSLARVRLRLPDVQPHSDAERAAERRSEARADRDCRTASCEPDRSPARGSGTERPRRPSAVATLGRRTAARRDRARVVDRAARRARRRANRQPRLAHGHRRSSTCSLRSRRSGATP